MKLSEHLHKLGRTVAYYPSLAKITGGAAETLFFCQLAFWTDRDEAKNGWIKKSHRDIEDETGLNRREQQTARKNLRARNLIIEETHGVPRTVHFKVNLEALDDLWEASVAPNGATSCTERADQLHQSRQLVAPNAPTIELEGSDKYKEEPKNLSSPKGDFANLWTTYPPQPNGTKPDKRLAEKQWAKLKPAARQRALIGAKHYADACKSNGTYAKHAWRWLRDGTFEDWQTPARASPNGVKTGNIHYTDEAEWGSG